MLQAFKFQSKSSIAS